MGPRRVVVVGYDNTELLDIACVTTTLALANEFGAVDPAYDIEVATPGGRPIDCVSGLTLHSHAPLERLAGPLDTVIISGGPNAETMADDPRFVSHIRRLARQSRRVASVCTGVSILAATGLLDGRRATTHWAYAGRLAARHPTITVDPHPIYIQDGNVYTSAGITSALDLTLALVEQDHGPEPARTVARSLVIYLQRPGNQAQMSMFMATTPARHHLVRSTVDHITSHLDTDLDTATLAAAAGVSERHLTRLFVNDIGQTPSRHIRRARAEAAARLLTTTTLPITHIATRCGFNTTETLRQAFITHYGIPPSRYRATQAQPGGSVYSTV